MTATYRVVDDGPEPTPGTRLRELVDRPADTYTEGPLSALDVAAAFLKLLGPMDSYRLQKLCYYAQAQHLAQNDTRLFAEPVEAWKNGPVVRSLYNDHRRKYTVHDVASGDVDRVFARPSAAATVGLVIGRYGDASGIQLSNLTHREAPWRDAFGQGENTEITVESMRSYYRQLNELEDAERDSPAL